MEKIKLRKEAVYGICASFILILIGIFYYINTSSNSLKNQKEDYTYVTKLFDSNVKSVVSTQKIVMRPFNNADVKVLKTYYDYKAEEQNQENSIINYETTYMQNTGTVYGGLNESFDVTSILDGKLQGKIVIIQHDNNITSIYKSLSEVTVKENDQVSQGTVIGKSGESNLEKDLGNHVTLEITVNGTYVNPETCIDKQIVDIKVN